MKKAIITGAHGFIGRHTSRVFSDSGWSVEGIGLGNWSKEEQKRWGVARWVEKEISHASLTANFCGADAIIHCAGSGSVGISFANPHEDFVKNVQLTAEVLNWARENSAKTVFCSSGAVYGSAQQIPTNINCKLNPCSPYGYHKQMAESLCLLSSKFFDAEIAIIRLFSVYGEELKKQLFWEACKKIVNGDFMFFGTGDEIRDWVHVKDAAKLLLTATELKSSGPIIVNGGTGIRHTNREVLQMLFTSIGVSAEPLFNNEFRAGDPQIYLADISETLSTGWKPQKSLKDGIKDYVKWFQEINQ